MLARALQIPIFLAALAGCGSLIQGQVDGAEICKTVSDSVPAAPPTPSSTQKWSADYQLGKALPKNPKDAQASIAFTGVTLTLTSGVTSFDFVDSSQVTAGAPGGPSQQVAAYGRDFTKPVGAEIDVKPGSPVDVLALLQAGTIHLDGSVTGKLPQQAWTMDIRTCFSATYNFSGL